jgi:3-oxoacyl-[acyl-carrier protein] reductase
MRKLLEGKTAIITGASRGIGKAIAELFAAEGASVVLTDISQEELDKTVDGINTSGGKALGITADVVSTPACQEVFSQAIAKFGQVDILVNNAGVGDQWTIEAVPDEEIDRIIGINLRGPFIYCREAVKHMLPRNSGVIINVSSVNGVRPMCGAAYTSTKGGLNTLTKNIAIRLVGTGIRCNAMCPGFTITPMSTAQEKGEMAPEGCSMVPILHSRTVRNLPAEAVEQANVALFLASDLSSAVTGQILVVDKGQYL